MTSPFSPDARRFISWQRYCELESLEVARSLVGEMTISDDIAHRRIVELAQQEAELGFVYYAEKQWLEHCLAGGSFFDYEKWVVRQGITATYPRLNHVGDHDDLGEAWIGNTEDVKLFWRPVEFTSDVIQFDNVQLVVPGDTNSPNAQHLCKGFKILHNLAYFLHFASQLFRDRVWLDEVVVGSADLWHLDLINDVGSAGRVSFNNHEILDRP